MPLESPVFPRRDGSRNRSKASRTEPLQRSTLAADPPLSLRSGCCTNAAGSTMNASQGDRREPGGTSGVPEAHGERCTGLSRRSHAKTSLIPESYQFGISGVSR